MDSDAVLEARAVAAFDRRLRVDTRVEAGKALPRFVKGRLVAVDQTHVAALVHGTPRVYEEGAQVRLSAQFVRSAINALAETYGLDHDDLDIVITVHPRQDFPVHVALANRDPVYGIVIAPRKDFADRGRRQAAEVAGRNEHRDRLDQALQPAPAPEGA